MDWRRDMKFSTIALIAFALIMALFPALIAKDRVSVLLNSNSYSATINSCDSRTYRRIGGAKSQNWSYFPVAVSEEGYKAKGTLAFTSRTQCERLIGKSVDVFVNTKKPDDARINSFSQFWAAPIAVLFGALFIILSLLRMGRLAVSVFFGFFLTCGIALAHEFGAIGKNQRTGILPVVNNDRAIEGCILEAMAQQGVSNRAQIKRLECKDRGLNNIEDIEILINLEYLDVRGNDISTLQGLEGLTRISKIKLDGNTKLKSLDGLQNLIKLEEISARSMQLYDIGALSELMSIRKIDLNWNKLTDITAVKKLTSLESIILGDNPGITDISALAQKPELRGVLLYNTSVTDISPLFNNTKLRTVRIGKELDVPCHQIHKLRFNLHKSASVSGKPECN